MKFKDLNIEDEFECYGDIHLNYDYPKICKCVKISFNAAYEIDGISFLIDPNDTIIKNNLTMKDPKEKEYGTGIGFGSLDEEPEKEVNSFTHYEDEEQPELDDGYGLGIGG